MKKEILFITSFTLLSASVVTAADIAHGSSLRLSDQQNLAGSVIIDLTAGSASASGTNVNSSTVGPITLGDGTVSEYKFFNGIGVTTTASGSANVYASAGSSISTPTFPADTVSSSTLAQVDLTLPDGTTNFDTNTGIRASDLSGTINTAGYNSGTIYFIFATAADYAQVQLGDSNQEVVGGFLGAEDTGDAFDTTGTSYDFSGTSLGASGTAITSFTFDNVGDSFADATFDFRFINTDLDGSRARAFGIIVDGVAIPESSSYSLIASAFALGAVLLRRRK
ncbi:hypothetical protein SH580_02655 [Coraliomargarita algicola]|uniref:PEP-CTERM sorting domain-containing protein n=1 Tax=Coraliomargarita algicola TaxID=3092156 RepID=A0ABZ0RKL9_9BACT|nr:hypothetical protein [Coraliomargarita sp. J2-16]WPJ96602.1 hypothetical protein SH580_02655 [Coraliomargarita sp. J2-16]